MTLISLNVEPSLLKKLDDKAKRDRRTRTAVINHLVEESIKADEREATKNEPPKKKKPVPGTDAHLRWTLDLPPKGRICAEDRSVYATALARSAAEAINPVNP